MLNIAQPKKQAHPAERKLFFVDKDKGEEILFKASSLSATLDMLQGLYRGGQMEIRCCDPKRSGGFAALFGIAKEMVEDIAQDFVNSTVTGTYLNSAKARKTRFTGCCVAEMFNAFAKMALEDCIETHGCDGYGNLVAVFENASEQASGIANDFYDID